MENYISIEKLIKDAKKSGVGFGKGDPYNRLRYYTKIGWLPHMERMRDVSGEVRGHYPISTLRQLILIEKLKTRGISNEEITQKITLHKKTTSFINSLTSKEFRHKILEYAIVVIVATALLGELGILRIGKSKSQIFDITKSGGISYVLDSGTAFVPRNQDKVFISSSKVTTRDRVLVTFSGDYIPATRFWVSEIRNGEGFLLVLDTKVRNNTEFNWWVTN